MKACLPYQIVHVQLEIQLNLPEANCWKHVCYLVFWWKDIPLGHLYLEYNQILTEEQYYLALSASIESAVQQYAVKRGLANKNWQTLLANPDHRQWKDWMNSILAASLPSVIPPRVPVSVIICTRNRALPLKSCLQSLISMSCQPAEIIVVDNCPTDASTWEVVKEFPQVKYYVESIAGLSYARNTGVKQSTSDIIAFTDDDVLLHPDWAFRVWETFLDEHVFAMTGLVLVSELQTKAQQIFEKYWSFNRGYTDTFYDSNYLIENLAVGPPVWQIGAGANGAYRREVFESVGLFDVRLGAGASGCSEDSEMWFRILAQGLVVHYNPRAVVYHAHREKIKDLKRQIFYYMRGHAVAALIQQEQQSKAGYSRRIYRDLPIQYAQRFLAGFPFFRFRYQTLWIEFKGLVSGVLFYYRNRKQKPMQSS